MGEEVELARALKKAAEAVVVRRVVVLVMVAYQARWLVEKDAFAARRHLRQLDR